MPLLATMTTSGWRPGPGDPTVGGWLVFVAYLVGAALCFHASRMETRGALAGYDRLPAVWRWLAVILVGLGLNKQLDLHAGITYYGRQMAGQQGWYQDRREVQLLLLIVLAIGAVAVVAECFRRIGLPHRRYLPPLIGATFLVTFILYRAASFHHVDAVLSRFAFGIKVHAAFELSGICVIGASALRAIREDRDALGG